MWAVIDLPEINLGEMSREKNRPAPTSTRPFRPHLSRRSQIGCVSGRAFPEDDVLLDRLIVAKSIGMIAGQRGGGKTWLVILICYSVAGGKNLSPWGHGKKRRVVYLDGEMRAASLQNRLKLIHEFNGDPESKECVEENLLIISRDYMGSTIRVD